MNSDQLATLIRLARVGLASLADRQDPSDASNCWAILAAATQGCAQLAASEKRQAEVKPAEVVEGPQG